MDNSSSSLPIPHLLQNSVIFLQKLHIINLIRQKGQRDFRHEYMTQIEFIMLYYMTLILNFI